MWISNVIYFAAGVFFQVPGNVFVRNWYCCTRCAIFPRAILCAKCQYFLCFAALPCQERGASVRPWTNSTYSTNGFPEYSTHDL